MADKLTLGDLKRLASEARNPRTEDLDLLPIQQLVARINAEDKLVAEAVEREIPQIAQAVEVIVAAHRAGGRLIYVGAGTSGRLGVLDASECPPTFSVAADAVLGLIAGGDTALRHSVETAEDNPVWGRNDLRDIGLTKNDAVVGISVSGRTPYVLGALEYARSVGATTIALTCVGDARISHEAEITIAPRVGAEILTGSTRMKSGTAQKMVLNMLSTATMIRSGRTYKNLMVDVTVSNQKLETRAVHIICEATGVGPDEAAALLAESDRNVKLAILMGLTGLDKNRAQSFLTGADGFLRAALSATQKKSA
ncbi:MAG: N-acetylmuramic acid 6-phosphate etherase [Pseudomonadota bacterium]